MQYQGEFYTVTVSYAVVAEWPGNHDMFVFSCRFTLPSYFDHEIPFWHL